MTGRADAVEGQLAEIRCARLLGLRLTGVPRLEAAARERLDRPEHVRVLVAAELAALAPKRAGTVGAKGEMVRLAGDRVEFAL